MWTAQIEGLTWIEVANALHSQPGFAFLDSASAQDGFSYIGLQAFGVFEINQDQAYWDKSPINLPPLEALTQKFKEFEVANLPEGAPFQGGAIGTFAYDFSQTLQPINTPKNTMDYGPQASLPFYATVLAYNHSQSTITVYASGLPSTIMQDREKNALKDIAQIKQLLSKAHSKSIGSNAAITQWQCNLSQNEFEAAVEQVQEHILAGDVYQVNLARRMSAKLPPHFDTWQFYLNLRKQNAAPFGAYLQSGKVTIASSSPECFIQKTGRTITTKPIKGTIARGALADEDETQKQALLNSQKDRAENVMIVDLLRNDFSKVCKPNTVKVLKLCEIESYPALHHMVSTVEGDLQDGLDALDVLKACFPGGSITGAPKRAAMEIINELEAENRGTYCGVIGYWGWNGDMATSIAIRTVMFSNHQATFHAGGGITLLSKPKAEFEETQLKAQRIFKTFGAS